MRLTFHAGYIQLRPQPIIMWAVYAHNLPPDREISDLYHGTATKMYYYVTVKVTRQSQ